MWWQPRLQHKGAVRRLWTRWAHVRCTPVETRSQAAHSTTRFPGRQAQARVEESEVVMVVEPPSVVRYLLGALVMLAGVVAPLALAASRTLRRGTSLSRDDRQI